MCALTRRGGTLLQQPTGYASSVDLRANPTSESPEAARVPPRRTRVALARLDPLARYSYIINANWDTITGSKTLLPHPKPRYVRQNGQRRIKFETRPTRDSAQVSPARVSHFTPADCGVSQVRPQ